MRELKFRAWDTTEKYLTGAFTIIDCLHHDGRAWDYHDSIWMQFTGLKDKNGKEIYSGDIIRDERGMVGVIVDFRYGPQFMWLHEYHDWTKGAQVVITEPVGHMQTASWLGGNEVIGNIYENPELLEKDNV